MSTKASGLHTFAPPRSPERERATTKVRKAYSLLNQNMIEERGGAPYGVLLAAAAVAVALVPLLMGDQGEAITDFIAELLSPVGLLLLPIILLLLIQFLSSDTGSIISTIFSTGDPETIHRISGSPVGVTLFLLLIIFLLCNRFSIFGGGDDSGH